jgi:hypothetical protein
MKQIAPNYSYNKTTGVITLTGVDIDRDQLLLIVNTTRNVTYYNFADSATTLQAFTQGANTSITLASSVVSASSAHTNADALTIYYDDQASSGTIGSLPNVKIQGFNGAGGGQYIDIGVTEQGAVPVVIESAVTALAGNNFSQEIYNGIFTFSENAQMGVYVTDPLPNGSNNIGRVTVDAGTVTSLAGGETPTSGTATLTTDTRWELNTEGFGHIAIEVVSSGVTWSPNGLVAQAYNGTAPSNADILAPAGIRYRHSSDTSVAPTTALNNIYYNLGIGPTVGNGYGTNLVRVDGSNTSLLALPTTGTRYFLFDLTTSRFALRPFFTAGSVTVKYRLYKERHPFFSARNIVVTGEGSLGAVKVQPVSTGNVYVDGGYLNVEAIADGEGNTFGLDRNFPVDVQNVVTTYPQQGSTVSNTNFSSLESAELAPAVANRESLTAYNEGSGTLFINVGGSASTTSYQVRLLSGDYWEAPAGQQSLQHSAIFGSAGTARVTQVS